MDAKGVESRGGWKLYMTLLGSLGGESKGEGGFCGGCMRRAVGKRGRYACDVMEIFNWALCVYVDNAKNRPISIGHFRFLFGSVT